MLFVTLNTERPGASQTIPGWQRWGKLLAIATLAALSVAALLVVRQRRPDSGAPLDDEARERFFRARVKADPTNADARTQLGIVLEKRGYYMAALDQLQAAHSLQADDRDVAGPAGRCLFRLNRLAEARPELESAVRLNPDSTRAATDLAGLLVRQGDSAVAGRTLDAFVAAHRAQLTAPKPDESETIRSLMLALSAAGERSGALEAADALTRASPGTLDGYLVGGRQLIALGRPQEAAQRLQKAVSIAPDAADAHYVYGLALAALGRRDDALGEWVKTVRSDPAARRAYYRLGEEYARRQVWDRAAESYGSAAELDSDAAPAYRLAADASRRSGDANRAAYCTAMAAKTDGDYAGALAAFQSLSQSRDSAWRTRGLGGIADTYNAMGRPHEFLAAALKAARPGSADDLLRVADAYLALKDYPRREAYLNKALSIDHTLAARVHRELAAFAESRRKWPEAERFYAQAASEDPNNALYHRGLAHALLESSAQEKRPRAVQEAERAAEANPADPQAAHQLGVACGWAGDLPRAVEALEHAIDLQPGNAGAYLDLYQVLTRQGNRKRAEEIQRLYAERYAAGQQAKALAQRTTMNPRDASALIALAAFDEKIGVLRSAAVLYARALRFHPADSGSRDGLARMKQILGDSAPGP